MKTGHSENCVRCGSPLPGGYDPRRPCPRCLLSFGLELEATPKPLPTDVPTPGDLAELFPELEIHELVGQGATGLVYRAQQKQLGRNVALKILSAPEDVDAGFAERFLREAQAMAQLSHPNIVSVHDYGQRGELVFLTMEFVEGSNLRHQIQTGALGPSDALGVVVQVCQALQYAHDRGIVHRDIKPENILVDGSGRVKIADFGLAKIVRDDEFDTRLTRQGQAMGTPHYMAPEQIETPLSVDHRADIYALGVVLYELFTGELPIGRFAPPSKKVQVDVRLDDVVLRALEKEPAQRYQRAADIENDLEGLKRAPAPGRTSMDTTQTAPKGRSLLSWILIFALILFLVLIPITCVGALFLYGTASMTPTPVSPSATPGATAPMRVHPGASSTPAPAESGSVESGPGSNPASGSSESKESGS